jgi:hypothetical protein
MSSHRPTRRMVAAVWVLLRMGFRTRTWYSFGLRLLAASSNPLAHGHRRPDAHGDLTDSFVLS